MLSYEYFDQYVLNQRLIHCKYENQKKSHMSDNQKY